MTVIDPQELVCASGHVDVVRLSFSPLLVEKLEHRIIVRLMLDKRSRDIEDGGLSYGNNYTRISGI